MITKVNLAKVSIVIEHYVPYIKVTYISFKQTALTTLALIFY